MKDNVDWDICPPEILCTIFKCLDTKALTRCMLVNRKWKDIAEYIAEYYKLWETIVKNEMINEGTTFTNKSNLDWKNIFRNSMLWHNVKMSDVKHKKTYEIQGVKKMNVYKDNLILINDSHVMYYDIKTFTLIRAFESACLINFEENDHTIVEFIEENEFTRMLHLYVKLEINKFEMDPSTKRTMKDIKLYRLESKWCYALTSTNILWAIACKTTRWDVEFLGRHYGSDHDPVIAIHVCNNFVYIVTKWGTVWHAHTGSLRFIKVYKLNVSQNISQHDWVMFDTFSCVVPVTNQDERVKGIFDSRADVIMLECSELTCALQHGDVLLLGYNDGRVEIHIPKNHMTSRSGRDPERYFDIQQFHEHVDDSTITGLNVCEMENSHVLLVSTRNCIFQLQLTYPEDLL